MSQIVFTFLFVFAWCESTLKLQENESAHSWNSADKTSASKGNFQIVGVNVGTAVYSLARITFLFSSSAENLKVSEKVTVRFEWKIEWIFVQGKVLTCKCETGFKFNKVGNESFYSTLTRHPNVIGFVTIKNIKKSRITLVARWHQSHLAWVKFHLS